jgi:hypothetical protein
MTAISLALDENLDLYLDSNGNIATVTGIFAVEQDCDCTMRARLGEMIYQTNTGIPYLQTAFQTSNPQQFKAAGISALEAVPDVVSVVSFDATVVGKTLDYVAEIESIYGNRFING